MAYTFLNASMPINVTPKETYVNQFQETLNEQFENASDIWNIEEETSFGSGQYNTVSVRLMNHILKGDTGIKIADDFKKILFKDIGHAINIGGMYRFNDNYWLTVNADIIKNLAASAVVKRCNNVLRWIDKSGAYHETPCIIDYTIKNNRDYSTVGSSMILPAGELSIMVQFNQHTRKIKPNQRFLFGSPDNWIAYKVEGGGIGNFDNKKTFDNESQGLIRMNMMVNFVNDQTDDIINGIADVGDNVYRISLSQDYVKGNIGQKLDVYAEVTLNGIAVTRNLTWKTSDSNVATVADGVVTFVANGICTLTCELENNSLVYDTCTAETVITPVSEYEIIVTPNQNYVLQTQTENFKVELYLNNMLQSDIFTFTLNPNSVPLGNYVFTVVDGNNFTIENKKVYMDSYLIVECVSGSNTKNIPIYLKGGW